MAQEREGQISRNPLSQFLEKFRLKAKPEARPSLTGPLISLEERREASIGEMARTNRDMLLKALESNVPFRQAREAAVDPSRVTFRYKGSEFSYNSGDFHDSHHINLHNMSFGPDGTKTSESFVHIQIEGCHPEEGKPDIIKGNTHFQRKTTDGMKPTVVVSNADALPYVRAMIQSLA